MSTLIKNLKQYIEERNACFVDKERVEYILDPVEKESWKRKFNELKELHYSIVKSNVRGEIVGSRYFEDETELEYFLHYQFLIRSKNDQFYIEEQVQHRKAKFLGDKLIVDQETKMPFAEHPPVIERQFLNEPNDTRFVYDRREAVRYAERWWNDYNPAYRKFENNCTNFVSQCLRAGGAPMWGYPNRSKGWWYQNNNWSYSWSVAHAFRWYLSGSTYGLRGQEMKSAKDLSLGDVICYDFDGNGHFQHTTIVVAKDENGMPLVNAQTSNSRMRYWSYQDSTAWTPNIKYKFFHIVSS